MTTGYALHQLSPHFLNEDIKYNNVSSPIVMRYVYRYMFNGQIPDNLDKLFHCQNETILNEFVPRIIDRMLQTRDELYIEDELKSFCECMPTHSFKQHFRKLNYGLQLSLIHRTFDYSFNDHNAILILLDRDFKHLDNMPLHEIHERNVKTIGEDVESLIPQLSTAYDIPSIHLPIRYKKNRIRCKDYPLLPSILIVYGSINIEVLKRNWKELHVQEVLDFIRSSNAVGTLFGLRTQPEDIPLIELICRFFRWMHFKSESIEHIRDMQ